MFFQNYSIVVILILFLLIKPYSCYLYSALKPYKSINPVYTHQSPTKLFGIPKLFRWLVELYPIVLESVGDGLTSNNVMKIDNFYLDMNGIIHSCTHSNNDKLIALNEVQMFQRIFTYTDNLYKLVKPSKLMFLAIDGVAPRAKMNQQRSRRFKSSKEREILLAEYIAKEGKLPDEESFDSNCITPGTEFMYRLGIAFRSWIQYKMKTDKFWITNGAMVVFSGPDVPGEGEHKVIDMIRSIQKGYDLSTIIASGQTSEHNDGYIPGQSFAQTVSSQSSDYKLGSLRHCMYGLDADLIMLSLATHEPHFVLLREKITRRKLSVRESRTFTQEDYELLEITILRKMLRQHFRKLVNVPEKMLTVLSGDAKTILDNRFSVAGAEGAVEENSMISESIRPAWKRKTPINTTSDMSSSTTSTNSTFGENGLTTVEEERIIDDFIFMCFFVGNDFLPSMPHMDISDGSLNLMMNLYRDMIPTLGGYLTDGERMHLPRIELFIQEIARKEALYFEQRAISDKEPEFATEKYKEHYYKTKLGIEPGDKAGVRKVIEEYIRGLAWVLRYYHSGCGSWTWYYPYLYAPLASDIIDICNLTIEFEVGVPFTPLLQLLSVLPPQSGKFLPYTYEQLMLHEKSPLYEYYPKDFEVDANGKKNSWECIVKIPFINEKILLDAISNIDHQSVLSDEEKLRNLSGKEYRYSPINLKQSDSTGQNNIVQDSTTKTTQLSAGTTLNEEDIIASESTPKWGNAILDTIRSSHSHTGHSSHTNRYSNQNRNSNMKPNSGSDTSNSDSSSFSDRTIESFTPQTIPIHTIRRNSSIGTGGAISSSPASVPAPSSSTSSTTKKRVSNSTNTPSNKKTSTTTTTSPQKAEG